MPERASTPEGGVERRELRRRTPSSTAAGFGLPFDMQRTAVRRLGFVGLVIAVMGPGAYLAELKLQPTRIASPDMIYNFPLWVAVCLAALGALMCVVAWTGKIRGELTLDIGLVFQVLVAFLISLSESGTEWPPGPVRGLSWNCLWITMYVVVIPGTYGKSSLAAFASACMAPFGLLVATTANGWQLPTPEQMAIIVLPPFTVVAWAIPVARYLHRLGRQVSRARAMGSYELLELIGKGGMGEVWSAKHRMLARSAAIKVIRPDTLGVEHLQDGMVLLRRFEREARATASLRSPHTVVLYDYGVSDDAEFYYVMELLDGIDLETLVQKHGPQPAGRAVWLIRQAAKSLGEAHQIGLVHRDVKPRNIFCCRMGSDDDFVKVLDFGLVKLRAGEDTQTQLTRAGVTAGTPAYMAPEVASARSDVDGRADLYSLGCVAYWLLTGQLVFEAENAMATVLAHYHTPPVPPSRRTELPIPDSLERIVMACLEKDPAARPRTAEELIRRLDSCTDVEPWSQERAAKWWSIHMPAKTASAKAMSASA